MSRIGLALLLSLLAGSLLSGSLAAQESPRRRAGELGFGKRPPETATQAQACAEQGPGFRRVGGSCLRIFGGVRTEVTTSRTLR